MINGLSQQLGPWKSVSYFPFPPMSLPFPNMVEDAFVCLPLTEIFKVL